MTTKIESKSTPGPWHVDPEAITGTDEEGIVIRDAHGYRVAETYGSSPQAFITRDGYANACLIAKAPEMLLFVELAANGADLRYAEAIQVKARALLAEIDGGQP